MHTYLHICACIYTMCTCLCPYIQCTYDEIEVFDYSLITWIAIANKVRRVSWYFFQVVKSAQWMEMVCQCISTRTKMYSCPRILCPTQTFRHRAACPPLIHINPSSSSSCLVVCHICFRHRLTVCQAWLHWAYSGQTTATHMEELNPQSWITLHLKWSWVRSILRSILSSILKVLGKLPCTYYCGSTVYIYCNERSRRFTNSTNSSYSNARCAYLLVHQDQIYFSTRSACLL